MSRYSFPLYRTEHKGNVAVLVSFEKTTRITNPLQLKQAITRAVTNWVLDTQAGKNAWDYCGGDDFNIGDLGAYLEDTDLQECLSVQGVTDLQIETLEPVEDWNFDSLLADSAKIEEALDNAD